MNLLRLLDLDRPAFDALLDTATAMKAEPTRWLGALKHQTIVGVFALPSTRTRLAFAAAAHRLGMLPFFVGAEVLQLARGEEIADTARSLSSYAALIVARLPSHANLEALATAATVPVVNALSDQHHPCEALASMLTLREHFGRLDDLRLAYVGDGNNVAHSLIEAGALAGVSVAVATPPGHKPDEAVVADAHRVATATGADVVVGDDPVAAVSGADAVFTDVWVSMGDEAVGADHRRQFASYQVNEKLMRSAARNAVFVHCLPARRGEEVTAEVLDGPRSLVWAQVRNHLHVAQSVIWTIATT
jgi:ornithine carbamoyltransferase